MNEELPHRSTVEALAGNETSVDGSTSLVYKVGAPRQWGRQAELLFVLEGANEPLTGVDVEAIGVTIAQIGARLREQMSQCAEALRQVGEKLQEILPAVRQAVEIAEQLGDQTATGGAVSPRVPTYQDHRPRHESPYGPRRRQR